MKFSFLLFFPRDATFEVSTRSDDSLYRHHWFCLDNILVRLKLSMSQARQEKKGLLQVNLGFLPFSVLLYAYENISVTPYVRLPFYCTGFRCVSSSVTFSL